MNWTYLVALLVLGGLAFLLVARRRQRRLTITQQSIRCPAHECSATLAVETDPVPHPWRRYVDVTACSLLPSASFVSPPRTACFSDLSPSEPYFYEASHLPHHSTEVACPKHCLQVLNAADAGAAVPIRCSSGTSDSLELARQTQSPGITRLLWYHSI